MPLIDTANSSANWHDVLAIWNRLANWTSFKSEERELNQTLRLFALALWSEKDWLIAQYPDRKADIEAFVSASEPLSIVADLANTAKHRVLDRKRRSTAEQTSLRGQVSASTGAKRQLHYLKLSDGRVVEIMAVLRRALDALESFRIQLRASTVPSEET